MKFDGWKFVTLVLLVAFCRGLICQEPSKESEAALPSGREVVEAFVRELGGESALKRVRSFHVKGRYVLETAGAEGTIEIHFAEPDKILFAIDIPGYGRLARGYDGKTGWAIDPAHGPVILQGDGLTSVRRQALRRFSVLPYSDRIQEAQNLGVQEFGKRPCYKIRVRLNGAEGEFFDYYDTASGFFAGREETTSVAGGEAPMVGWVGKLKEFGDYRILTRWDHEAAGQTWYAEYSRFEVNSVSPAVFAAPDEVQALLSKED